MTESSAGATPVWEDDDGLSLLALGSVLLRWRRTILALAAIGGVVGLADGLTSPKVYKSVATFVPKASQGSPSGLALAASQFGVSIASATGDWSPAMYVELIRSRALLEPIALDTVPAPEGRGRTVRLIDLVRIKGPTPEREVTAAVGALSSMMEASEAKKVGGVTVSVKTKWPSVSLALANRLLLRVNEFNLETRKSQAVAERQFVEAQSVESERALREAENRLQTFLQANREIEGSPGLVFERDRLAREVTRRNQLYTAWLQSREEARIREIRDIPVITVLESPRLPFKEEPRKLALKTILGGIAGAAVGVLFAFLADMMMRARRSQGDDAREFFGLLEDLTPKPLRRKDKV